MAVQPNDLPILQSGRHWNHGEKRTAARLGIQYCIHALMDREVSLRPAAPVAAHRGRNKHIPENRNPTQTVPGRVGRSATSQFKRALHFCDLNFSDRRLQKFRPK